jgi:hypothetical protein
MWVGEPPPKGRHVGNLIHPHPQIFPPLLSHSIYTLTCGWLLVERQGAILKSQGTGSIPAEGNI